MNKQRAGFTLEKNRLKDQGKGVIAFPGGQVIIDGSKMWSGAQYDIESMDISDYKNQLTVNHSQDVEELVGSVTGLKKNKDNITIEGIKFAVNDNPLALYTYNMMKAGFITDFSIESMGPWPGEDNIFRDAKLAGLSVVVYGNNKNANVQNKIQEIAINSINESRKSGLDTSAVEGIFENTLDKEKIIDYAEHDMNFVTIKNTREFEVTLKYKNASGQDAEIKLAPSATFDVSEDQKETIENAIKDAKAPEKVENPDKAVQEIVRKELAPVLEELKKAKQDLFDSTAKEPEFKISANKSNVSSDVAKALSAMGYEEVYGKQVNYAWEYLKNGSAEAGRKLRSINEFNLENLKEKKLVKNSVTLADFGNFVISPELLTEIAGHRSNFQSLISALDFKETLSLQMAWLVRNGDVNMTSVDMCDVDGGNLKPISEYTADIQTSNLEELAAVTPVCNAATRFLAADLLSDVAQGYRTDYARKLAQLFIARLQQAVNTNGNKIVYRPTSDTAGLKDFVRVWSQAAEEIEGGTFIFNTRTYGELVQRLVGAGISGPLSGVFTTGDSGMLLGRPYIVVPNELLPALNSTDTKTFVVEGANVTINQAVFYTDLANFKGRVSGGLSYDLSTEAAYEVEGVVKSAYQRNELVIRGSFFRGGQVLDTEKVSSLSAAGIS